jgi:adenylyltransferase/sulfurtransferase
MKHISPEELHKQITSGAELFLLDVREDFEHEVYNIGGTLIPLAEVLNKATEIPKDKTVVIYCRKGVRSQIAIQKLEERFGYTNLINLAGGMENWKKTFD